MGGGLFGGRDNRLCCLWYSVGLGVRGLWVSMFDVFGFSSGLLFSVGVSWGLRFPLDFPPNKLTVTRNDDEISASPRNMGIYMILFEQNCNNLKMAAIGRNM